MKLSCLLASALFAVAGCGGSEAPNEPAASDAQSNRDTVFEPLLETVDRARTVQQTVDDHAAELRRRLEEAED